MEQKLVELGAANGIWALLFVVLFLYTIYDSRRREANYQKIINDLSDKFGIVEDIQKDVSDIKTELNRR
jgi:hypothetical protein